MRYAGVTRDRILANALIVCSSLAKAFGVPAAVLAGSRMVMDRFENESRTRVHCSPPSAADVAACSHVLDINEAHGDALRNRLAQHVGQFREGLRKLEVVGVHGNFPVQPIRLGPRMNARRVHAALSDRGIETVFHRGEGGRGERISFIVTAHHSPNQIETAVAALAEALAAEKNNAPGKDRTSWLTRTIMQGA